MKRSPLLNPSSVMKRSFWSYCAVFLVVAAFGANAFAGTPIWVNVYQSMEQGNNGDLLTNAAMNATSYGTQGWVSTPGPMWVSTNYHTDLPNPINCGGTIYNGTGGSRSWMFNNNIEGCYVECNLAGGHNNITLACYYTTLSTNAGGYDVMVMQSVWLQTLDWADVLLLPLVNPPLAGLNLRQETLLSNYQATGTVSSLWINPGHTYWVNMKYDGVAGVVLLAVFDPANNYAQVGGTAFSPVGYNNSPSTFYYGRQDEHGNFNDPTQAYFDQIMYDYTNGAFPLLPSGSNDVTPPSAPPNVRDGLPCGLNASAMAMYNMEQSMAMSSTQLSANWDPAWDAESGIKAYQYAIGTTSGGTNVVNWTTIPNQLAVTATGLSLTKNQPYYFSVRAINGVGYTGAVTTSPGQTYGLTESTGPSAPAAVRDGGRDLVQPDIDSTSNAHDLYSNFDPATDTLSGISGYQFCIGTTPGGSDAVAWTSIPAQARTCTAEGLNPPNGLATGVRYYTSVRAINGVGSTGPATTSDGQVVIGPDTTPPSAPPRCGMASARAKRPPPARPPNSRPVGPAPRRTRAAESWAINSPLAPRLAAPTSSTGGRRRPFPIQDPCNPSRRRA